MAFPGYRSAWMRFDHRDDLLLDHRYDVILLLTLEREIKRKTDRTRAPFMAVGKTCCVVTILFPIEGKGWDRPIVYRDANSIVTERADGLVANFRIDVNRE